MKLKTVLSEVVAAAACLAVRKSSAVLVSDAVTMVKDAVASVRVVHSADFSDERAYAEYAGADGGTVRIEAGVTVKLPIGTQVRLVAQPVVKDLSGGSCKVCGDYSLKMFQWWTVSPASAGLGDGFDPLELDTSFQVPKGGVTLTPMYVDEGSSGMLTMFAGYSSYDCGDDVLEPDEDDLEWSPDAGKHWFKSGTGVYLKAASYTIAWRSLNGAWLAPTVKPRIRVRAGENTDNAESRMTDSLFTCAVSFAADVETIGCGSGGTVSMSPASGILTAKKSVSLTARTARGYVFVGFRDPFGELVTTETKLTLKEGDPCTASEDGRIHYAAVFRDKNDYREQDLRDGISLHGNGYDGGVPVSGDGTAAQVTFYGVVGGAFDGSLEVEGDSLPVTLKYTGRLPAGIQFSSKTGTFSGVPTRNGDYSLVISVADPAGNTVRIPVRFVIRQLPGWLAGVYRGLLSDDDGATFGSFELTVTAAGKCSGKVQGMSSARSLSGRLIWTPDEDSADPDVNPGDWSFELSQKDALAVGRLEADLVAVEYSEGGVCDQVAVSGVAARALKTTPAFYALKYYTVPLEGERPDSGNGYLTLKTDVRGGVKIAGMLSDGTALSASASLLDRGEDGCLHTLFYQTLKSKKEAFSAVLQLDEDGSVTVDEATWFRADGSAAEFSGSGRIFALPDNLSDRRWMLRCAAGESELFSLPLAGNARGQITLDGRIAGTTFSFTRSTGVFSGRSATNPKMTFKGVMISDGDELYGCGSAYCTVSRVTVFMPVTVD